MEDFLEEVVLELSLEGHVRNQSGRGSGRESQRGNRLNACWSMSSRSYRTPQTESRHSRNKRQEEGSKEGMRLENQTKTK